MPAALYDTAAAMAAAEQIYQVAVQNLANLRVHGYRRRAIALEMAQVGEGEPVVAPGQLSIDFRPGTYEHTGNPLDVAISGEGFFVLEGPNGPVYTRAGSFVVDPQGRLVSPSGYQVVGTGGPITVPLQAGQVRIVEDGTVTAGDQVVGRIRVVRFANPQLLRPVGPSLFAATPQAVPEPVETPQLVSGTREGSNVEPIIDLVQLILATRYYEASQRVLQTYSDMKRTAANDLL